MVLGVFFKYSKHMSITCVMDIIILDRMKMFTDKIAKYKRFSMFSHQQILMISAVHKITDKVIK